MAFNPIRIRVASRAVHHAAAAGPSATAPAPPRAPRRRDAHALAGRVKYDPAPPPPPVPRSQRSKAGSSLTPRSDSEPVLEPTPGRSAGRSRPHSASPAAGDWANAQHPKWDERGSERYDVEPVLPEEVDGLHGGEGDYIVAERGGPAWDGEDEWLQVLRQQAEHELQHADERPTRDARSAQVAAPTPSAGAARDAGPPPPAYAPALQRPTTPPEVLDKAERQALTEHTAPRAKPTPRQRPSVPLRLDPVPRSDPSLIAPYLPFPTAATAEDGVPPPLLSRHDWRLAAPLRRYLRRFPPPLFSRSETDTQPLGHNRLVGVGVDAARIGKYTLVRGEEPWGWKVRVPESERGDWIDADVYRTRLTRLLDLSRKADEQLYLSSLVRQGTPAERELKGTTLCRAVGRWLTDSSRADELARMSPEEREKRRTGPGGPASGTAGVLGAGSALGGGGGKMRAVACFEAEDGRELTEDQGWKFASGTILRFTLASSRNSELSQLGPTGPQAPPGAASIGGEPKWHVQGTILEVREDQLIVAFDEVDMWPLGDEAYQLDIGLDTSSYALQSAAIDNLYLDPARQRAHNETQVSAIQHAFLRTGTVPTLREWALQGTELREAIVPASQKPMTEPHQASATATQDPLQSDLLRQNQLINSWIERYRRDEPIVLPGDPDLGLNASQTKAIAVALGDKLSLIQGPPGTGKSQTIVSLIALLKLHFRIPSPILLAAPTHVSVDHLVLLLVRAGLNPLRCGKAAKVSPEVQKWTIEKRQEQHPLWDKLEKAREESEGFRLELQDLRDGRGEMSGDAGGKEANKKDAELEGKYRKAWRKFIMLEHKLYSSLLATADVFCATALGSGASKVLNMVDFPIVLLDEAAMCTEPVSLIPLMKGSQQATLIGDHKQLPAVVTSQEAKDERLHLSLFERLLTSQKVRSTLLDTQYRMRPSISSFPNQSFYSGALRDAASVTKRPPPLKSVYFGGPAPRSPTPSSSAISRPIPPAPPHEPVAFVSHTGPETVHRQSLLNRTESDILISIVGDLLRQNPTLRATDIGIISPYYAQTRLLVNTFESGYAASRLRALLGAQRAAEAGEVEINTVDGFQGREKRVVLLSTVRSNAGGFIGFLTDRRRLNVALTRAKDALIVVGNERTLRRAAQVGWSRDSEIGRGGLPLDVEFDDSGSPANISMARSGSGIDPDADPGVWRRFLEWCTRRGLVRQWEEPVKSG